MFTEFYQRYPRKVARKDAERAWNKLTPQEREAALEALPTHIRFWTAKGTEKVFIPHPATWLNGARWEDEIEIEAPKKLEPGWWTTEKGILAKGLELGVHPRPGQSMSDYRSCVVEAARCAA